jgi:hypothetical protein
MLMDIAKDQKYKLPDLFNSVFDLYMPRNLSHGATNLLFALLYKFNQVPDKQTGQFFPKKLSIYNFELAKMLGINEKTLIKLRNELINFRLIPENNDTWIISYESGGTREAGFYSGNFNLLSNISPSNMSEYYSQHSNQLENNNADDILKSQDIGIDIDATFPENSKKVSKRTVLHNSTQLNIRSSSSSTLNVLSTNESIEKKDEEDIFRKKAESIISKYYPQLTNSFLVDDYIHIGKFPEEQIENVVKNAKREDVYFKKLPVYIMKGLDNYQELYGNNGKKPYSNEATPYKNNEKQLEEDRAIHEKKMRGEYYE